MRGEVDDRQSWCGKMMRKFKKKRLEHYVMSWYCNDYLVKRSILYEIIERRMFNYQTLCAQVGTKHAD